MIHTGHHMCDHTVYRMSEHALIKLNLFVILCIELDARRFVPQFSLRLQNTCSICNDMSILVVSEDVQWWQWQKLSWMKISAAPCNQRKWMDAPTEKTFMQKYASTIQIYWCLTNASFPNVRRESSRIKHSWLHLTHAGFKTCVVDDDSGFFHRCLISWDLDNRCSWTPAL